MILNRVIAVGDRMLGTTSSSFSFLDLCSLLFCSFESFEPLEAQDNLVRWSAIHSRGRCMDENQTELQRRSGVWRKFRNFIDWKILHWLRFLKTVSRQQAQVQRLKPKATTFRKCCCNSESKIHGSWDDNRPAGWWFWNFLVFQTLRRLHTFSATFWLAAGTEEDMIKRYVCI